MKGKVDILGAHHHHEIDVLRRRVSEQRRERVIRPLEGYMELGGGVRARPG
jgi:hypothetical protein